jgi:DNA-binding CsgD family transcriptional regulator
MKLLDILLVRLGLRRGAGTRLFELEETLHMAVVNLADEEQRSAEDVHTDLLAAGLAQVQTRDVLRRCWDALSVREQEVTALTCLGYTNRQIAGRLGIAEETVKTHVKNALVKFGLHGKAELRRVLEEWDFGDWKR